MFPTLMAGGRSVPVKVFGRFLVVGLTNTAISYLAFRILLWLLVDVAGRAAIAQAFAYAIGIGWSYLLNSRWTFAGSPGGRFARFLAVQLTCLAVSALALGALVDVAGLPPTLCWIAVMAAITVGNFLAIRYWAFADSRSRA